MNSTEWVAENVMGFERKQCDGDIWFGHSTIEGVTDEGFVCRWCGEKRDVSEPIPPCPEYPFPSFTLVDLMRELGDHNLPTFVRFDTLRPEGSGFTVMLSALNERWDTDDPLRALCDLLYEHLGKGG